MEDGGSRIENGGLQVAIEIWARDDDGEYHLSILDPPSSILVHARRALAHYSIKQPRPTRSRVRHRVQRVRPERDLEPLTPVPARLRVKRP